MSQFIPNALVESIMEYAMDQADFLQAARLALVNKQTRALYKKQTKLEDQLIEAIHTIKTHTFSVVIKTVVKGKIVGTLMINKARAVFIENTTIAFADTQHAEFMEKVHNMAKTANLRDVRTKITFSKKDDATLQVVMMFVKYLTAKCIR